MGLLELSRQKGDKSLPLSRGVAVDRYQIKCEQYINGVVLDSCFFVCAGKSSFYEYAEHIVESDELAKSISKWSSPVVGSISLNEWQEEAMDKALRKPFQLIQGPPGNE